MVSIIDRILRRRKKNTGGESSRLQKVVPIGPEPRPKPSDIRDTGSKTITERQAAPIVQQIIKRGSGSSRNNNSGSSSSSAQTQTQTTVPTTTSSTTEQQTQAQTVIQAERFRASIQKQQKPSAIISQIKQAVRKGNGQSISQAERFRSSTQINKRDVSQVLSVKRLKPKKETKKKEPAISSLQVEDIGPGFKQPILTSVKQSITKLFNPQKDTDVDKMFRVSTVGSEQGTARRETFTEKVISPFGFSGKTEGEMKTITPQFGSVNLQAPTTRLGEAKERFITTGEGSDELFRLVGKTDVQKKVELGVQVVKLGTVVGASLVPGAGLPVAVGFIGSGVKSNLAITKAEKEGVKVSKLEKIGAVAELGIGFGGVRGSISGIERGLVESELRQLSKADFKFKGDVIVDDKTGLTKITGVQTRKGLRTEVELGGKIIRQNEKAVFIPEGVGVSTTTGKLSFNIGKEFRGGMGTKIFSSQSFQFGSKSVELGKVDDLFFSLSRTSIKPQASVGITFTKTDLTSPRFGSDIGKSLKVGGEPIVGDPTISISKQIGKGIDNERFFAVRSGTLGFGKGGVKLTSKEAGIIKETRVDSLGLSGLETKETSKFIKTSLPKEKRTPFSATFGTQTQSTVKPSIVGFNTEGLTQVSTRSIGTLIPKAVKFPKVQSPVQRPKQETQSPKITAIPKQIGKGINNERFFAVRSGTLGFGKGGVKLTSKEAGIIKETRVDSLGLSGLETKETSKFIKTSLPKEKRTPFSATFGTQTQSTVKPSIVGFNTEGLTQVSTRSIGTLIPKAVKFPKVQSPVQRPKQETQSPKITAIPKPQASKLMMSTRLNTGSVARGGTKQNLAGTLRVSSPNVRTITKTNTTQAFKVSNIFKRVNTTTQKQKQTPSFTVPRVPGITIRPPTSLQKQTPSFTVPRVPGRTIRPPTSFFAIPKIPIIQLPKPIGGKGKPINNLIGVQVRRRGQFFNVGNFSSPIKAFKRGKDVTTKTLAATFKLTGKGKIPSTPKGFRRKVTKEGTLFIEKRSQRLKQKSEVGEINLFGRKRRKR